MTHRWSVNLSGLFQHESGPLKPVDLHTCQSSKHPFAAVETGAQIHEVHLELELGLQTKSRTSIFTHTLNSACVKGARWQTTQAITQQKLCQHAFNHFNTSVAEWSEGSLLQLKNPQTELKVLKYHRLQPKRETMSYANMHINAIH